MKRIKQRPLALVIAVLGLCMAYLIFAVHAATPTIVPPLPVAPPSGAEIAAAPQLTVEETNEQEQEVYARKTAARIADLERMENERHLLAKASERTATEREILRVMHRPQWSAYYTTNWAAFQELRAKAAHSVGHKTACTICDGTGRADICVLCGELHGKCARCRGTGKTSLGGYCPACLGTGKCYLCGGTGSMPCDFCEDGVVTLSLSPRVMLPLE